MSFFYTFKSRSQKQKVIVTYVRTLSKNVLPSDFGPALYIYIIRKGLIARHAAFPNLSKKTSMREH